MSNRPNFKSRARPAAPAPKSTSVFRSPVLWVVAIVVIAAAIALAFAAGGDDAAQDETAFAEIIGDPLPELTTPDPVIGQAAPEIAGTTLDGTAVRLDYEGTARVIGFFAHWCPHCQAELPQASAWLNERELPPDVEVVAVSTAVDASADNYPPSAWFEKEQWPADVVIDSADNALADGFGLTAFPYWVAVDADGNVAARVSGGLTTAQLDDLVESLST